MIVFLDVPVFFVVDTVVYFSLEEFNPKPLEKVFG